MKEINELKKMKRKGLKGKGWKRKWCCRTAALAFVLALSAGCRLPVYGKADSGIPAGEEAGIESGGVVSAGEEAGAESGGAVSAEERAGTESGGAESAEERAGAESGGAVSAEEEADGVSGGEGPSAVREEGLERQIRAYCEIRAGEAAEALREAVGTENKEREIRLRVLTENGVYKCEVTRIEIYPAGKNRFAFVSYDLYAEGIGVKLPGLEAVFAVPGQDGGWIVRRELPEMEAAEEELIRDSVRACWFQEDIQDWSNEINMEYNDAVASFPEAEEWAKRVNEEWMRALAAEMEETEKTKETEATASSRYIVKEGDCLWRIARKLLGSGAKWHVLYDANRELIGEDPDLLLPGTGLVTGR